MYQPMSLLHKLRQPMCLLHKPSSRALGRHLLGFICNLRKTLQQDIRLVELRRVLVLFEGVRNAQIFISGNYSLQVHHQTPEKALEGHVVLIQEVP